MATKSKITGKEKSDFNRRLLKIYDKLPSDFANKALEKDPSLSVNRVMNVRYNKTVDFEILEILEGIAKK